MTPISKKKMQQNANTHITVKCHVIQFCSGNSITWDWTVLFLHNCVLNI